MIRIVVVIHAAPRMSLENIMLSERNQSQSTTYRAVSAYTQYLEQVHLQRQKVDEWFPRAGGDGEMGE